MTVFSAMYHTLFYPSYLQDIRATTCLETSKNRLYSLFKPVYVPYILRATWDKVSVEVFAGFCFCFCCNNLIAMIQNWTSQLALGYF